jgi:PKD repeat protein
MKKILPVIYLLLLSASVHGQSYIIGYEYWCDTSYSSRTYVAVPPQQQFTLDALIGFPGTAKGLHLLNIRFQQTNFYWSNTISEYFIKTGEGDSALGKIKAYRYWVDGIDSVVTFHLATPASPLDLIADVDLSWVHEGSNHLHMQFSDEADNWSVAIIDSFYKSAIPAANFTTADTLICGADSVHFQNMSNDADIYQWYFGDGDSSNADNPVHYYQQPGSYTVTLIATDTTTGTDSTLTITDFVVINNAAHASFTFSQVNPNVTFSNTSLNAVSYLWDFGDSTTSQLENPVHSYQQDGNYMVILTAFDSCGSSVDTQYVSIILKAESLLASDMISITQDENLNVRFNAAVSNCRYELINAAGQIIYRKEFSLIRPPFTDIISIKDLNAGIYYLMLFTLEGSVVRKIFIAY